MPDTLFGWIFFFYYSIGAAGGWLVLSRLAMRWYRACTSSAD